jgi:hypothetical protein
VTDSLKVIRSYRISKRDLERQRAHHPLPERGNYSRQTQNYHFLALCASLLMEAGRWGGGRQISVKNTKWPTEAKERPQQSSPQNFLQKDMQELGDKCKVVFVTFVTDGERGWEGFCNPPTFSLLHTTVLPI